MAQLTEKKATLVLTTHHDLESLKPTKKTQRFGPIRAALTADQADSYGQLMLDLLEHEDFTVSVIREYDLA
ncbi:MULTISPECIES: hypothetical protein [unclassified Exiguobacterium]|uniref:hypothetical protein n=1 Tax=unclassified Exiguobacterium TaxID=2644629 RepID=UPI0010395580|nr:MULTISPECIES: hypothetical protein [unclassified Exiguobacterium]TCI48209.1 hypothetical protein EVJ31_04000 [Exiguobacterium sp. SH5S32]TCI55096.1 hypothetical protein EVJ25_03995 [Exiguobacterium sp. SH1S4]TCI74888.1 hypothetical protein EVJ23_03990 [Exiguobacterium sp. SH1S1]